MKTQLSDTTTSTTDTNNNKQTKHISTFHWDSKYFAMNFSNALIFWKFNDNPDVLPWNMINFYLFIKKKMKIFVLGVFRYVYNLDYIYFVNINVLN